MIVTADAKTLAGMVRECAAGRGPRDPVTLLNEYGEQIAYWLDEVPRLMDLAIEALEVSPRTTFLVDESPLREKYEALQRFIESTTLQAAKAEARAEEALRDFDEPWSEEVVDGMGELCDWVTRIRRPIPKPRAALGMEPAEPAQEEEE